MSKAVNIDNINVNDKIAKKSDIIQYLKLIGVVKCFTLFRKQLLTGKVETQAEDFVLENHTHLHYIFLHYMNL